MYINIKTPTGKTITLEVEPSDSVENLKFKFQQEENIPIECQKFEFAGHVLLDGWTLSQYSILNGTTIFFIPTIKKASMEIYFKMFMGKTITLNVEPSYYIEQIKEMLQDK